MAFGTRLGLVIATFLTCYHTIASSHGNHQSLNILLVSAPAVGHMIPLASLGRELADRGHKVMLCSTVVQGAKFIGTIAENHGVEFLSAGVDPRNKSADWYM